MFGTVSFEDSVEKDRSRRFRCQGEFQWHYVKRVGIRLMRSYLEVYRYVIGDSFSLRQYCLAANKIESKCKGLSLLTGNDGAAN